MKEIELNKDYDYNLRTLNDNELIVFFKAWEKTKHPLQTAGIEWFFKYAKKINLKFCKDEDGDLTWNFIQKETNKPVINGKTLFKTDNEVSDFKTITDSIASLLEYKNKKYGNSALEPLNVFKGKCKVGDRLDDKLARVKNNDSLQKNDVADLIGYLFLVCKENNWNNFDEFKD